MFAAVQCSFIFYSSDKLYPEVQMHCIVSEVITERERERLSGKEKVCHTFNKFFFLPPCCIVHDKTHRIKRFLFHILFWKYDWPTSLTTCCLAAVCLAGVVALCAGVQGVCDTGPP